MQIGNTTRTGKCDGEKKKRNLGSYCPEHYKLQRQRKNAAKASRISELTNNCRIDDFGLDSERIQQILGDFQTRIYIDIVKHAKTGEINIYFPPPPRRQNQYIVMVFLFIMRM
jgi:hypothetical protein